MKPYGLRNRPLFGFRNVTDCALTLPFNSRHVAELHGFPNDGCQVPRSGQAKVASHQTDGPRMKLGYDNHIHFFRPDSVIEHVMLILNKCIFHQ